MAQAESQVVPVASRPTGGAGRLPSGTGDSGSEPSAVTRTGAGLVAWLVFLAIGGGVLAQYYAEIRYMPDMEWHSALTYIAAATFIGAGMTALFYLSVFLPGFIWSQFLICAPESRARFCDFDEKGKLEARVWELVRLLGLPFWVVLLITHAIPTTGIWSYYVLVGVVLLISSVSVWLWPKLSRPSRFCDLIDSENGESNDPFRKRWSAHWFWFTLSIFLGQTAVVLIIGITGMQPTRTWNYFTLTLLCSGMVSVSNHVVASIYHVHPKRALAAGLIAAFLLLLTADRLNSLPTQLMALYGFGSGQKVDLVLRADGIAIAKDLGLTPEGERLRCVEILSRLGSDYFLRRGDNKFTLPKEAVASWETTAPNCQ
jgi:hypothetical protein